MNERTIMAFLTVAKTGSFTKAAEELYCSNVTVMNQVNSLEKELGTKVFIRSNHGTELTESGSIFYEDALNMYNYYKNTINRIQNVQTVKKKEIRVGTSVLRPCSMMNLSWRQTAELNNDYRIKIVTFNDDYSTLSTLLDRESGIDCYVGPFDSSIVREKYDVRLLKWLPCRVAVPKTHRLSQKKSLTWKDMEGERMIVMKNGLSSTVRRLKDRVIENPLRRLRDEVLENHASTDIIDVGKHYTLDTFNMCVEMNCLMETLDIWKDIHPGMVTLPMEWEYACPYGILFSKYASEDVRGFMDAMAPDYDDSDLIE